jgi:hypothetical protein
LVDQLNLQLRKLCVLLPVTEELMQDSELLNNWIDDFVAQRIAWNVDRAILYGDPATSMGGIMGNGSGNGVVGVASADPVTETVFHDFEVALAPANKKKAEWYMSNDVWGDVVEAAQNLMNHHELVIDNGEWYLFGHKLNVMEQLENPCDLVLGDFSQYVTVSMGDAIKSVSIQFKFNMDDIYIRFVIRLTGDSFGQSYTLAEGNTVGTFVVPEQCAQITASTSSSTSSSSSSGLSNSSESSSSTSSSTSSQSTQSLSSESTTSSTSSSGDSLLVTGNLSPNATGNYAPAGMKNGKPYYSNGTYYIWYIGGDWIISTFMGQVNDFWYLASETVEGTYAPIGTYTGDPDVNFS